MSKQLTHEELTNNQLELKILNDVMTIHAHKNAPLEFLLNRYLGWDEVTANQFVLELRTDPQ